ncbi:hypothetical protein VN12_20005 [Pirellula sp. SH-Sr6A]|uniref:hypothetical protein n=1 Tax=Pirellula sp. SH-Sr6A TaxID=1632865 RepID=UPI00078EDE7D|nr:hypothetical protein [Pirellula sp. SH-Sr6A]AMV34419.1 hypothetical protein VN12_20005 [Pirellula sp. SH-Sr6A]
MHPHEESLIRSFIQPARRLRWLQCLQSANKRGRMLDRLNHCRDFDTRFTSALSPNVHVQDVLAARNAPKTCYVLSANDSIDGREMELSDAIEQAKLGGWGTLIGCIPNRLAYYFDECGERQMLLERDV